MKVVEIKKTFMELYIDIPCIFVNHFLNKGAFTTVTVWASLQLCLLTIHDLLQVGHFF